ncbi:MAG TPA: hypothetical protein VNV44_05150 [Solirubrobacteraceae bacterium]|nr:hypothetical protein [Solirubrobacteraceae bacterium]
MARFEDRLWTALVEQHGALLAEAPAAPLRAPAVRPRRLRRVPALVAGAATILAIVLALVIGLGSNRGASAFAVVTNSDGTVTVTIGELVGVTPADERLQQLGLPVRVVPVTAGCPTVPAQLRQAMLSPEEFRGIYQLAGGEQVASVRIDPSRIPHGDTLILRATERPGGAVALRALVIEGAAPPCLPPSPGE